MMLTTLALAIIPESLLKEFILLSNISNETNIIINRFAIIAILFLSTMICCYLHEKCKKKVTITGKNYKIIVEYDDIFEKNNCKKVIPFDECFTTKIGDSPADININSVCGQYLKNNPINDTQMQHLITTANISPSNTKSAYQNKERYESGSLIPKDDFLLMSFAKLDSEGLGTLTFEGFLQCLFLLWKEINKYYGQQDVYIPVLGSGVTRFDGGEQLSKQELVNIILYSYKMSQYKIKLPNSLHVICKESDDFSLSKIDN